MRPQVRAIFAADFAGPLGVRRACGGGRGRRGRGRVSEKGTGTNLRAAATGGAGRGGRRCGRRATGGAGRAGRERAARLRSRVWSHSGTQKPKVAASNGSSPMLEPSRDANGSARCTMWLQPFPWSHYGSCSARPLAESPAAVHTRARTRSPDATAACARSRARTTRICCATNRPQEGAG